MSNGEGDGLYNELPFEVSAEFEDNRLEEEGKDSLRVDTQGGIMGVMLNVDDVETANVEPNHAGGFGGRWTVECQLIQGDVADRSALHSKIRQALQNEEDEADWIKRLKPEWSPRAPPG